MRRRARAKSQDGPPSDPKLSAPGALDAEAKAKWNEKYRSFGVRCMSTVLMISGFVFIVYCGHVPLVALILFIQWCMVRELFELARESHQENKLPGFRAQQWFFFGAAAFFFYLRFIKNNLLVEITSDATLSRLFGWFLLQHSLISYSIYTAGLILFVLGLKKGLYLYQFGQFAWTHMILMIVFVPSSFFVSNIFQGLIWFLLPCSLIITNDITAYLAGFFFGKTPLIKVSPKKTWEGFIGGFVGTVLLSFVFTWCMSKFDWMICPRLDLSMGRLNCPRDEIYQSTEHSIQELAGFMPSTVLEALDSIAVHIPPGIKHYILSLTFFYQPMMLHGAVLAVFASVISPFGGFFASGFKRAFKVKDFAAIIPGHGGMTDRMDCQVLMAVFSYLYCFTLFQETRIDVGGVLDMALSLDEPQQLELFGKLGTYLVGEGVLPDSFLIQLSDIITRSTR